MIFVSRGGTDVNARKGIKKAPFRFLMVAGASLFKDDWQFAGRSETSRRTITASVKRSGYDKMMANWIYKAPALAKGNIDLLGERAD